MILNQITLINFRNYSKISVDLCNKINILIGDNAQGKTNILESIYVLGITKSHRAVIDNNLIKENESFCKIKGNIETKNLSRNLEFFLSGKEKKVFINKNQVKKLTDYISKFNIIIFTPDDLELVKGSPNVRRKFLNIEIGQIDNKYLNILNDYNKLLKTRNEYLKQLNPKNLNNKLIEVLNERIIDKALYIYEKRFEFIELINSKITDIYIDITNDDNLKIKYVNNLGIEKFDKDYIKNILFEKLNINLEREIILGQTLFGPHKDDFSFILNDNDVKSYGSQGQQRTCILSLKLSEIYIFVEKTKENPILLLDDIFSELDDTKKNNIIKYINKNIQTIITTTDLNQINKELLKDSYIYKIENGNVERLMIENESRTLWCVGYSSIRRVRGS